MKQNPIQTLTMAGALLLSISVAACAPMSQDLLRPRGTVGIAADDSRPGPRRIESAIRAGASRQGWIVTRIEDRAIHAEITRGDLSAAVRIEYDREGWEIQHVRSSPGLKHDPNYFGREIIHRRYNGWVAKLNRAIQNALSRKS